MTRSKMALRRVGKVTNWCKPLDLQKSNVAIPALEVWLECSQVDSWTLKSPQINGDNKGYLSKRWSKLVSSVTSIEDGRH